MADFLRKLKYSVGKESLERICYSFLRPKLEHGCHMWDKCDKRDKKKLVNFQLSIAEQCWNLGRNKP